MITTVDKNQDGKISYSEFRVGFYDTTTIAIITIIIIIPMQVMLGAIPLLIPDPPPSGPKTAKPKE